MLSYLLSCSAAPCIPPGRPAPAPQPAAPAPARGQRRSAAARRRRCHTAAPIDAVLAWHAAPSRDRYHNSTVWCAHGSAAPCIPPGCPAPAPQLAPADRPRGQRRSAAARRCRHTAVPIDAALAWHAAPSRDRHHSSTMRCAHGSAAPCISPGRPAPAPQPAPAAPARG